MTSTRLAYARATLAAPPAGDQPDTEQQGAPIRFAASTTGLNRYGYSLRTEGWRLDNYRGNPVFLWMHDSSSLPIGRVDAAVDVDGGQLLADVTFDQADAFAVQVEGKYRRGFLSAVSVGFDFVQEDGTPIEHWWELSAQEIRDEAFYDLAELSAVPVPADPGALRQEQQRALARLGRELAHLSTPTPDAQPSGLTAEDVRELVAAELARHTRPPEPARDPAAGLTTDAAQALLAALTLKEGPRA